MKRPRPGLGGRAERDRGVGLAAGERDLLGEHDGVRVGDVDPHVVLAGGKRQVPGGRAEGEVRDRLAAVDVDVDGRSVGGEVPDTDLGRAELRAHPVLPEPEPRRALGELAACEGGVALPVAERDVGAEHGSRRGLALRRDLNLVVPGRNLEIRGLLQRAEGRNRLLPVHVHGDGADVGDRVQGAELDRRERAGGEARGDERYQRRQEQLAADSHVMPPCQRFV